MSLTLSLSLLGLLILAILAFQYWWRTNQAEKLRRPFVATVSDGLRHEPRLDLPGASDSGEGQDGPGLRLPAGRRLPKIDALIDAIAAIQLESPVSGELAVAHAPTSRRAGTKPMLLEGLDAETGEWETPVHERRYSEFQAGVQLANRSGALNEIEYSEFVHKVQSFADGVGGMADFPDMLDVVARARELDQFAQGTDAQLSLQLRSNGVAWSVHYVQQVASRHGFVPGALPGRLVMPGVADGDPPMLVLSFDSQAALADDPQAVLKELTLSLDVAQTAEVSEAFPAWHSAATALCAELNATIVDENGVPVTLHAFDAIGKELKQLYSQLEDRDLQAGSPAARRLFS